VEIGAQLYTVRAFCKTLEDFAETLKKVADIGYKNVQVSGTCEYDPQWLADQLKKNGLKCVLTHNSQEKFKTDAATLAKNHSVFDCDYVGLGSYGFKEENGETLEKFMEIFTPIVNTVAENGKYFMYHNHDWEFKKQNGKPILQLMAEAMPADKFGFTLDTFWVQAGGGDPAFWIEKLSGRVPCIHLKDYSFGRLMAVIGEGNINFDRVFEKAEKAGTKYMLVEQDNCNGEDPFDCLNRSFKYLKSCGF
jgi:sugar phosphate isomerase/epimerase